MAHRKDSKNRVLMDGEFQRKDGLYVFKKMKQGVVYYIYSKNLNELRRKEKILLNDIDDGINCSDQNLTVNNFYERWRKVKAGIRDSTKGNYYYYYDKYVKDSFGNNRIRTVTENDVTIFYNSILDNKKLSMSTLENINNVVHQVFDTAVKDNYIRRNVVAGVLSSCKATRRYKKKEPITLTSEQQSVFLRYLRDTPKERYWFPLFMIAFGTGCRIGETAAILWSNVDLDKKQLKIVYILKHFDKLKNEAKLILDAPKTDAGKRELPLLPEVVDAFIEQKHWMELMNRKCTQSVDGHSDFVFLNKEGRPFNPNTLNQTIKRLVRDCNKHEMKQAELEDREAVIVPKFSCHSMRHSFCTRFVEKEERLAFVKEYMGHTDIRTTISYVKTDPAKLKESINKLNMSILVG